MFFFKRVLGLAKPFQQQQQQLQHYSQQQQQRRRQAGRLESDERTGETTLLIRSGKQSCRHHQQQQQRRQQRRKRSSRHNNFGKVSAVPQQQHGLQQLKFRKRKFDSSDQHFRVAGPVRASDFKLAPRNAWWSDSGRKYLFESRIVDAKSSSPKQQRRRRKQFGDSTESGDVAKICIGDSA